MVSSHLLRLTAFSALFLAVLGCQPSNNPTNGDNKLYTDMTFTMEDVNLNARWTGGAPNTTLPQTQGSPTAQITKDIQILVNGILGEFKLPQDMVAVTVSSKDNKDVTFAANDVVHDLDAKCMEAGKYINYDDSIVYECSSEAVDMEKKPSIATFTITGNFKASMGATQVIWDTLAHNLQEQLDDYVKFNHKDLTVEPTSST